MKKLFCLILSIIMLLPLMPAVFAEDSEVVTNASVTAGSAVTVKKPISAPTGSSHNSVPPSARDAPSSWPAGMKPMLAPVRKVTRPTKV